MHAKPHRGSPELRRGLVLTPPQEDYLACLADLSRDRCGVHVTDVASALGRSLPSVTAMLQRLQASGMILRTPYGPAQLTLHGLNHAQAVLHRRHVLTEFLEMLGLEDHDVHGDVEGIEHHISPSTLRAIEALTEQLRRRPALLAQVTGATP